ALALGAQGAMVGTGFLATRESFAHDYHKRRVIEARADETVLTHDFHINWPPGAAVRVLPNSVTRGERGDPQAPERQVIGADGARPIHLFSTDSPLRSMTGDFEAMALYAGEGAGRIGAVGSAAERLAAIVDEAAEIIGPAMAGAAAENVAALSSSACSAHEADAAYMGYADRAELLSFLNELLEAERAFARTALRSALGTADARLGAVLHTMHEDAARCCTILFHQIKSLGAIPSPRVGALYGRAIETDDLAARLVLITRGQGAVAQRLREMLPRIRDDALHADLLRMRQAHEANIARGEAALAGAS
ncbi:MAG: DUF6306 domain-containing protein, partial [Stellaceae bacterium]